MLTFAQLGRYGRFANQLFQIAGTIGLATQHGYAYGFPAWKNYDHAERFGSPEDIDLQKYFANPLPSIDNAADFPDRPIPWGWHENLNIPDNVSLSGHMQSEKYFAHCKDLIQHYFMMKDEGPIENICAIHLRLGDYDNNYHPRLTEEYYKKAISQFPADTEFLLFSDDTAAAFLMVERMCSANEDLGRKIGIWNKGDYIEQFRLMKSCKHFITGNSSYSLMAAILGKHPNKKIVCPANWFGPAWGSQYQNMSKDIYPQNSIVL